MNLNILTSTYHIFYIALSTEYIEGKCSKSVLGREAKSLKNGIPTLCKGLQFNPSASPCLPPKQTNGAESYRTSLESS